MGEQKTEILSELEHNLETRSQQLVIETLKSLEEDIAVAWGNQATMDYRYKVDDDTIAKIAQHYLGHLRITNSTIAQMLQSIAEGNKMAHDIEIILDGDTLLSEVDRLKRDRKVGATFVDLPTEEIGGSPAISADVSYLLGRNETFIGKTIYVGTYPNSVQRFVTRHEVLKPLFEGGVKNPHNPGTLCFEAGKYKLMISNKEGREIKDLQENGGFNIDVHNIAPDSNVVFAIGGLNKGEPSEYTSLIEWSKRERPECYIFVGTNSFEKQIKAKDYQTVRGYFEVLRRADVVSMNEAELDQIYEACYRNSDMCRTEKLEQLNLSGIAIAHSADGAIGHFGTGVSTNKTKKKLLKGILQLSCDATTRIYETGEPLNNLDEAFEYAHEVKDRRNEAGFESSFDYKGRYTVSSIAPLVFPGKAKGNITGLGASFDGYFMALISPLLPYLVER
jgi:hypothetical protein